jgi:hypothetical protein
MASRRAQLLAELLPALNELFGMEYENNNTTWAVYADYLYEHMEWRIGKIEPWSREKHTKTRPNGEKVRCDGVYMVTDAVDEMAAYKKFMKERGEDGWTK